jgi:hypothetical protein
MRDWKQQRPAVIRAVAYRNAAVDIRAHRRLAVGKSVSFVDQQDAAGKSFPIE